MELVLDPFLGQALIRVCGGAPEVVAKMVRSRHHFQRAVPGLEARDVEKDPDEAQLSASVLGADSLARPLVRPTIRVLVTVPGHRVSFFSTHTFGMISGLKPGLFAHQEPPPVPAGLFMLQQWSYTTSSPSAPRAMASICGCGV